MNAKILLLVLFISIITILAAQNHMDIMTTMTGEHNFAEMGWLMTTLDWNGDHYDDLVIMESGWRPNQLAEDLRVSAYGKLNVYLGGPNFDNIPEIILPGSYQQEYWATFSMCNAGHMNADSIDDLALFRATPFEGDPQFYDLQLCVFYGGANPDTIPDYVLTFPREEWDNSACFVRGLGDINNDGRDDLGYYMERVGYPYHIMFGIIYGGSMENTNFREISDLHAAGSICGLGDINADGIDDFYLGYGYNSNNTLFHRVILYYGNSAGVYSDSLVIADEPGLTSSFSYPAGDTNWDGYPDFVSFFSSSSKLYYGGPGFDGSSYVNISPPYHGGELGQGFDHGDVNGNGTDDFMGTTFSQSGAGHGDAYLWMGGVPMNGGADLHISPPDYAANFDMFGWCLTMGDYNGDGYSDAAISAPFDYASLPDPGRVFVYAGNIQLDDPMPISDHTNTPVISKIELYPNPLRPQYSKLNVKFMWLTPPPPSARGVTSTFEIYNIRGQKVKSYFLNAEQSKSGSANYNLNDLSSGVYVCVLIDNKQQIKGKITVIK